MIIGGVKLKELEDIDCNIFFFLITSINPEIFEETRRAIRQYVPERNIFDLYGEGAKRYVSGMAIGEEESIEWLNYWIEDADCHGEPRLMLIGDSVFRELRSFIGGMTRYTVDLIASTAYGQFLDAQMRAYFSYTNYSYDLVLVNVDHHRFLEDLNLDRKQFLEKLDLICNSVARVRKIVIVGATPELSSYDNERLVARNMAAAEFAERHGLRYIDVFEFMCNTRHRDNKHFYSDGNERLATMISQEIRCYLF